MSIYATLWKLKWPRDGDWALSADDYVEVWAQAVPPHIGHPSDYPDGDPYADFLPPPVGLDQVEEPVDAPYRAVFICGPKTTKGTDRSGQEYVNPLLMLTGEEYQSITWGELHQRISEALRRHLGERRTRAIYFAPDGSIHRITGEGPEDHSMD